ncbi:MAG: RHS repeat-associated core domain-containing protein, partial [Hyphomicrobium sp.]
IYGNASPSPDPYSYDGASNLVVAGAGRNHAYDGTNTRVKTTFGSPYGTVTTYEFRSAHGLLLVEWKKISGYYDNLTESFYLAGKPVAEQQTAFIPGGSTLPVSWMFWQPDANGSVISSTWAGGGLMFKENYQPYGSQLNGTAAPWTKLAFAGRTQDKTDLIYMGGRYYNPVIGRFLSMDPKEADPSDLHSLNRYAYANNNPYRYVDPDGYSPVDLVFFAIDAVKLGAAIYTGGDVAGAAIDLGLSAVGVFTPMPGTGQALKTLKVADKVVDGVRAADNVVDAAKAAKGIGPDFIVSRDGAVVHSSADKVRASLEGAGFPGKAVSNASGTEAGTLHNIPGMKMDARVMNGGPNHPTRVVTSRQGTAQPVNPSNGSNFGNVPKNEQRGRSHIVLP